MVSDATRKELDRRTRSWGTLLLGSICAMANLVAVDDDDDDAGFSTVAGRVKIKHRQRLTKQQSNGPRPTVVDKPTTKRGLLDGGLVHWLAIGNWTAWWVQRKMDRSRL
ncbi:hypothetical protein DCS_07485 [Drechmeria coniospora]|uniref:Uncharacterized protein n=1 Tax=Drechmeria coniospora TaxID=98403 RepID=A0A151GEM5_DRECN|nr:hypothetical protein DCS_07485 [Drechmeria coniospora]KYK55522.1 hypothetical protein DCS_07485 [Drechmeria coniospora]